MKDPYIILSCTSLKQLQKDVVEQYKKGFEAVGGIGSQCNLLDEAIFFQSMILRKNLQDNLNSNKNEHSSNL